MKHLLALLILLSLVPAGCGTVTVRGAVNVGGTIAASGVVSIVHLTFASDGNGTSISVTVVTLLQSGTAQTLTFCGLQANQFPMDAFVTARFTAGTTCSNLVAVTRG